MSEREFVNAIQKHSGIIHKILYLYLDEKWERDDLCQEIQLQAWKAIKRFRGDSLFSTWLYRVALNTVFTYNRKKKIKSSPLGDYDKAEATEAPSEKSDLLFREIKRFNDVDKTIISLHLESFDNGEIADMLGISKNHVGVKLHRIKHQLHKKLNQQEHE